MGEVRVYNLQGKKVWVSGHNGMVGSAIIRRLAIEDCQVLTSDRSVDLRDPHLVKEWMNDTSPDVVIIAAARVGGIRRRVRRRDGSDRRRSLGQREHRAGKVETHLEGASSASVSLG